MPKPENNKTYLVKTNKEQHSRLPFEKELGNELIDKQNQTHNIKKQALGPNTKR